VDNCFGCFCLTVVVEALQATMATDCEDLCCEPRPLEGAAENADTAKAPLDNSDRARAQPEDRQLFILVPSPRPTR
jgi:hypothetical protein